MASMPTYHVSKGPFRILDNKFGKGNFAHEITDVLQGADGGPKLKSGPAGATLQARTALQVAKGRVSNAQAAHFAGDWLATWWPNLAVADTLRLGMLEALKCADDTGLPMEFFWVCLDENLFQVYFSKGEHQVTVLILTPPPPKNYNAGPLTAPEDLWVVKEADQADNAYPTVNGTAFGIVPLPVDLGPTTGPPPGTMIKQQIWHA